MAEYEFQRRGVQVYPFVEYEGISFVRMAAEIDIGKRLQQVKDFDSKQSDVILCSAMKTGSHWTHEIISMLLSQKLEYNTKESIGKVNFEGWMSFDEADEFTKPRLFHTHLPFSYLPRKHVQNRYKIIYVNRNPKDRAVSQYNFLSGKVGVPNWTWNEFFEKHVLKDSLYGGWFAFTRGFQKAYIEKSANILPVMYEELKLNPFKEVGRIAEFLQVPSTTKFIEKVVHKCDFDELKKNQYDETRMLHPEHKSTMFRKGKVGDWKKYFTVAQNEIYDRLYTTEMSGLDQQKFIYDL